MRTGGEVIVVAVDAGKEITEYAMNWVLRNVSTSLDSLIFLALLPSHGGSEITPAPAINAPAHQSLRGQMKKWVMRKLYREDVYQQGMAPDSQKKALHQDEARRINKACLDMIRHLCRVHKKQLQTQVKVITDSQLGSVASTALDLEATWVVLDRRLKKEGDFCMRQLKCNIVVMEHSVPKVMRTALNPNRTRIRRNNDDDNGYNPSNTVGTLTADETSFGADTDQGSLSSPDDSFRKKPLLHLKSELVLHGDIELKDSDASPPSKPQPVTTSNDKVKSYSGLLNSGRGNNGARSRRAMMRRSFDVTGLARFPAVSRKNSLADQKDHPVNEEGPSNIGERTSSIRRAISISIKPPPIPPPLCSICKHVAPIFGRAPKKFTLSEMEAATDGFSSQNLLAEGGHGMVYRGKLSDGQAVAVKKYKAVTAQSASEFCSEVEVLSCAQHRNLVMLVGYCIETDEWLLVYEFSCNGSLDKHLYGKDDEDEVMAWEDRMKVAVGVGRGLRYLHEDCRVGCIIHRDLRPQNILLTHEFEAMVGDFGLARWQSDGQQAEETRVMGTTGYLAPEFIEAGLITEKADVYAFGMVLLELLCGIKATEFSSNMGPKFLLELDHWLLERDGVNEILDPRLQDSYVENEVKSMIYASSLCLSPDPEMRPKMSKVLKILEGDIPPETDAAVNSNIQSRDGCYPNQFVNMTYGLETPSFSAASYRRKNSFIAAGNQNAGKKEGDEMDISGEYKAYIQGSLAKFFQGLSRHGKSTQDELPVIKL
ncbi:Inactive protein kinase SELMODRAFT_444075 [Linum perenne]